MAYDKNDSGALLFIPFIPSDWEPAVIYDKRLYRIGSKRLITKSEKSFFCAS